MEGADGGCWAAADTVVVAWLGSVESRGGMLMGGCGREACIVNHTNYGTVQKY